MPELLVLKQNASGYVYMHPNIGKKGDKLVQVVDTYLAALGGSRQMSKFMRKLLIAKMKEEKVITKDGKLNKVMLAKLLKKAKEEKEEL